MAEAFTKSEVVLARPFVFKHEVLEADWKLHVHRQNFVDYWA